MAAQVILNDNITFMSNTYDYYVYNAKLIVRGVAGVHGISALQPVVVDIKEETEQLFRRH